MGDADFVISDHDRRAYLLGTADLRTTHRIELALLGGGEELERIERLEDELIDDYVFERLADEENLLFWDHFLCTPARKSKLRVANELRLWATSQSDDSNQPQPSRSLISQSIWNVAGIAACIFLVVAIGLGVSNAKLRLELANARQVERNQVRERAVQKDAPQGEQRASNIQASEVEQLGARVAELTLSPGLTRAVQHAQVAKIPPGAAVVLLTLESLNEPPSSESRQQLFDADGRCVWSQYLLNPGLIQQGKLKVITVPAAILAPGDYQLTVAVKNANGKFEDLDSYSFRVLKDQVH